MSVDLMQHMNRFVAGSLLVLLVIAALTAGLYYYQRYSIILENPLKAVPADAAFIVEARQPVESLKNFFSSELKEKFGKRSWLSDADSSVHWLDSVLAENSDAKEIWETRSLVISAHITRSGKYDFLFLTNLPRGWSEAKLKRFIEKAAGVKTPFVKREYLDVNIYESRLNDTLTYTFASYRSIAMFSYTSLLVEQSLRQMKSGNSVSQSKVFRRIDQGIKTTGLTLYLNYSALADFASSVSSGNLFYSMAGSFARWSGLKASVMNSYLKLTGSTSFADSTELVSFSRFQQAQVLHGASIAPSRTAMLLQFGFSDAQQYFEHLNRQPLYVMDDRKKILAGIEKDLRISVAEHFTAWLDNEMELIITEPAGSFVDNNLYACLRASNPSEALNHLKSVKVAAEKKSAGRREEKYHNCFISLIPVQGIVPLMYGKIFSGISNCYYTAIDDYIVFANQASALKDLIDEYDAGKVLARDTVYKSALDNLPSVCNVRFYLSPGHASNVMGSSQVNSFISVLSKASGIHAQWSNAGPSIATNVIFDFEKKEIKEPVLLFSVELDTTVASTAAVARDATGQSFIFVQDENRNLYKINASGNVTWKKQWDEKILSGINVVDFYHDGRNELLFNTSRQLYLIDLNGESVGNYPIRLPAAASNGCTVTSINGSKNVTIFIACENHVVYAYQINGKPVNEWSYYHTNATVTKPIQFFTIENANYLAVSEQNDAVTFIDRSGNQKISFKDKFVQGAQSSIYFAAKDSLQDNHFVTTDSSGKIISLFLDGAQTIKYSDVKQSFSAQHAFSLADANGDGKADAVFLDGKEVSAFNMDGSLIYGRKFSDSLAANIYRYQFESGEKIFVTSSAANAIYMLNADGTLANGFPLKGWLYPFFSSFDKRNIMITGSNDFTLQVYELK